MGTISLTILKYQSKKGLLNVPSDITEEEALDKIRELLRSAYGVNAVLADKSSLEKMAEVIEIPEEEYIDYCVALSEEMESELYLHGKCEQPQCPSCGKNCCKY